jgi:hypothetical protein
MAGLGRLAQQQPQEIRERRTAAEGVLGDINADIGKAGTYDLPEDLGGPTPTAGAPSTDPSPPIEGETGLLSKDGYKFAKLAHVKKYDALIEKGYSSEEAADQIGASKAFKEGGIFESKKTGDAAGGVSGGKTQQRTIQLDPDAAKKQIESSSAFRQVSRMMAESEQMLARKGPLYDEMMRSTQLPIIEASASAARENTENIRRAMARGGAARRDAFEAVTRIRSQENLNMQRGQALAKAHTEMDMWARKNATQVMNFAQGWASNQAGIRESYQSAMDNASQLMSTSSIPFMFAAMQKEQEYRDAGSAQRRGKVMRQINSVIGVASSVVSVVGAFYGGPGSGASMDASQRAASGGASVNTTTFQNAATGKNISNTATATWDQGGAEEEQRSLRGDLGKMGSSIGSSASSAFNYLKG